MTPSKLQPLAPEVLQSLLHNGSQYFMLMPWSPTQFQIVNSYRGRPRKDFSRMYLPDLKEQTLGQLTVCSLSELRYRLAMGQQAVRALTSESAAAPAPAPAPRAGHQDLLIPRLQRLDVPQPLPRKPPPWPMQRDLIQALRLAHNLMFEHLNQPGWTIDFNKAYSRFGSCDYRRKTLYLNHLHACFGSEASLINTVMHEIAHALTPNADHGPAWQAQMRRFGLAPSVTGRFSLDECMALMEWRPGDWLLGWQEGATFYLLKQFLRRPKHPACLLRLRHMPEKSELLGYYRAGDVFAAVQADLLSLGTDWLEGSEPD